MRKILRFSQLLGNIRQSIVVILLFSFIGYTVLPTRSSADTTNNSDQADNAPPQKQNKNARKNDCPSCSPPGDQLIYIPLTDLPEAQGGELVFNSRSPKEMEVTPVFYKLDGTVVKGDPVLIQSAEIRYVDFKKLLPAGHRGERDWGGLALTYHGVAREMWAQYRLLRVNGGGNVDEFFTVKSEQRSDVQEAAWWMPKKSTAIIALGNITDLPTSATLSFGDGDTQTVSLAPNGTGIIRHQHTGQEGVESVKINITGMPGSIITTGVITSKDGSFNSVIRFYDTKGTKQPHLFANGFRLADRKAHMVLKNTSDSPITAQPKFIASGGVASGLPVSLPDVNLGPGETTEVDLTLLSEAVRRRGDLDMVSVQVHNSGGPGTLIGSLYSTNNLTGINYDTPLRDSGPVRTMTGSYPWKVTKDFTTIVYITNITDEEAEFLGEINYSGGHFLLDARKLAPGETAVLDLREIREKQEENKEGQKMSKDFSQGQLKWAVRGDTKGKIVLIGRAEMVSRSQNISTSYSCNDPCPPSYSGDLNPFPPPVVFVNNTATVAAWETAYYNNGYNYYTMGPYAVGASWTLDNAVGTLDPDGGHTTTLTGTSVGGATLDGFIATQSDYRWDGRDCYYSGTYDERVDAPVAVGPHINSISPSRGPVGGTVHILIFGYGFDPNSTPTVSISGYGVSVSDAFVLTDGSITATLFITPDASAGNHLVTVTSHGIDSNSVNFFVQVPTSLETTIEGSPQTYNGGPVPGTNIQVCYGYVKILTYTVLDQSTNPIRATGTAMENVQVLRTNIGSQNLQVTAPVDSNGQFSDYVGLCFPSPPPPQPGEFTVARQTINILIGNLTYTVRTNCLNQQYNNTTITNVTSNPALCQ
ncbi:MAG TPA: IPT/TIG domain-containing protein [Pyrinomonadaceae bacterium]